MSEILYLKFEKNSSTYNRTVTLGDLGEMQCADSAIVNRLKTEKIYTFREVRKGRHHCAARHVLSILDVVELIQKLYPKLEIQNLGETDFVVEYSTCHRENPLLLFGKLAVICLICFFGSAFSIMAFNEDVSAMHLFERLYGLLTGEMSDGHTILELTYSIGLSLGIVTFFNHFGGRRLTKDPTPIEVEMRGYEEEVNKALIQTVSRNGVHKKETDRFNP